MSINFSRITDIETRLRGLREFLEKFKGHEERMLKNRLVKERLEKLALDFNELVDDLLHPLDKTQETSKPGNQEASNEEKGTPNDDFFEAARQEGFIPE